MSGPPGDDASTAAPWAAGFRSVEREHDRVALDVAGELPRWLRGALYRNGPGRFEVGGERVTHWFDGLAMLTRFGFADGAVTYSNRFLRSDEYRSVTDEGRFAGTQFGSVGGLRRRLRDLVVPTPTDNANVNVVRLGDRFVAITETQVGVRFDPETLETLGHHRFEGLPGQTMLAHPHVDPRTGEVVTLATEYGRQSRYHVARRPPGAPRFEVVGSVDADRPSYVHSVGLTADHVVLVAFPFDVAPWRLLWPGAASFVERFEWRPEAGTRFVVVERATGAVVADRRSSPCFAFHHVNAYEEGGDLVVDLAAFDDPGLVSSLTLDALRAGPPPVTGGLRRYRVPLDGEGVTWEALTDGAVTLPRVAPDRNTRRHRFVYAQEPPGADDGASQRLLKVDVERRETTAWGEAGAFLGEPVFVPRPGRDREDDGVVCAVVLEATAGRSSLLVLDGRRFEPVARAPLPHVVPFDFHGRFVPAGEAKR